MNRGPRVLLHDHYPVAQAARLGLARRRNPPLWSERARFLFQRRVLTRLNDRLGCYLTR